MTKVETQLKIKPFMKKEVPGLIRIDLNSTQDESEKILFLRFNGNLKNEYALSLQDFYCYCAIIIKREIPSVLTEQQTDQIYKNGKLIDEVQFLVIQFKYLDDKYISGKELLFLLKYSKEKSNQKKLIIKKEIARTNLNGKELNLIDNKNSYYRELLNLIKSSEDLTYIDWYIPIVLKFERLIHIFVKHVEETKFAKGQFKNRTFFSYKSSEIKSLLKTIIRREADSIKEHYVINAVMKMVGTPEKMEDYIRNSKNPIIFDNEKFRLAIDKNGFIMKFHQI